MDAFVKWLWRLFLIGEGILVIATIVTGDLSMLVMAGILLVSPIIFSKKPTTDALLYWIWLENVYKRGD